MSIEAINIVDRLIAESEARGRTAHRVFTDQTLYEAVVGELAKRTDEHEHWNADCDMSARFVRAENPRWIVDVDYQHTTDDPA